MGIQVSFLGESANAWLARCNAHHPDHLVVWKDAAALLAEEGLQASPGLPGFLAASASFSTFLRIQGLFQARQAEQGQEPSAIKTLLIHASVDAQGLLPVTATFVEGEPLTLPAIEAPALVGLDDLVNDVGVLGVQVDVTSVSAPGNMPVS